MLREDSIASADPRCPPDWKWRVAGLITSGRYRPRGVEVAPSILAAVDYHRRQTGQHSVATSPLEPAVAQAVAIRDDDGILRAELEARLLTAQGENEIANRTGIPVDVVTIFHSLLFNVRPHLGAKDWLCAELLGDALFWGFRRGQLRQFWCHVALSKDIQALEHFVGVFRQIWRPDAPPFLDLYLATDQGIPLRIQASVGLRMLPSWQATASIELTVLWQLLSASLTAGRPGEKAWSEDLLQIIVQAARTHVAGDRRGLRKVVNRVGRQIHGREWPGLTRYLKKRFQGSVRRARTAKIAVS